MTSIDRAASAIATFLIREGIDHLQSKAVIKRARAQAGLAAPPEKWTSIDRMTIEEELVFIDYAYEAGGDRASHPDAPAARSLLSGIQQDRGHNAALLAADLLSGNRGIRLLTSADA